MKSIFLIAAFTNFFFWALAPKSDYYMDTVCERYIPPAGYERMSYEDDSFQFYLQNLPLKPAGSKVKYFNGQFKDATDVYDSVIDMDIDPVDLQQCADAIMRLRAEYLYGEKRYNEIKFNFLSDGKPRYFLDFSKGKRDYTSFRKYMKYIFSYANTASLHDELVAVKNKNDILPGDIFVQKQNPYGHAVIVLDVIIHKETNKKKFILAQSYMPAQETQVLYNSASIPNVWYSLDSQELRTPEWSFEWSDLRRFP